jgi:hypothetical protein
MWLLGGDRSRGYYQNEVWRSRDGASWQLLTTDLPWANRALIMAASFRGRLWVFGGMPVFESSRVAYNDVYSSADGIVWRLETAAAPWAPRGMVHGTLVFRDKLWVVGGGTYDERRYFNDIWCSDDGVEWTQVLDAAPWAPRHYHNVVVHADRLWVIGGSTAQEPSGSNDVWFTADGIDWQRVEDVPWAPRHAAAAVSFCDSIVLISGNGGPIYNDVWHLTQGPADACSAPPT